MTHSPSTLMEARPTPFSEAWQATAYALVEGLKAAGLLGLQEWADALGEEIAAINQESEAEFYQAWLRALETVVRRKGLVADGRMSERIEAWRHAYDVTPHGKPVVLKTQG